MNNEKGLTSNAIKIIAIIAVTIDHTPQYFFRVTALICWVYIYYEKS